jgi:hypothetical protein
LLIFQQGKCAGHACAFVLGHGDANRLRGVTREARSKKQKPGVSAGLWFSDGDA